MLFLDKRRIVTSALKLRYRDSRRVKWWLKDESLIPVAQSVVAAIRNIAEQIVPPNVEIIKSNERKLVFRIGHPQNLKRSFVAKVFLLRDFARRLKYYKYGFDETANLFKARSRGIDTCEVYGYGHIYDMLGLVKVSAIILQDLKGLSPIGVLMEAKSHEERSKIFMRTIPLFVKLFRAGCNHIDVNSGAVMFCDHNSDSQIYLLDFQHAKFYDKPSLEVIAFETGYFARACARWLTSDVIDVWFAEILNKLGVFDVAVRKKLKTRFDFYFGADLSRKECKKIF